MKHDLFKKKDFFEKNGFIILKNVLDNRIKKKLIKFANTHTFQKIKEWQDKGYIKDIKIKDKKYIYKKLVDIYLKANKPKYKRQPLYYTANKDFFNILSDKLFIDYAKFFLGTANIRVSGTHNFRYKSLEFPWAKFAWHADRTYWKEAEIKEFKFLTMWMTLDNIKNYEGCIEIIPRSQKKLKKVEKNFKFNKIFWADKNFKNLKKKKINLNKNDLLIFDSSTIHRTIPYNKQKVLWTFDIRYENANIVSKNSRKFGFDVNILKLHKSKILNKLIKNKPKFIECFGFNSKKI